MSAIDPITLQLSTYEKIQILRDQLEDRKEELEAVEVQIRDNLRLTETQRYLEGLSPFYAANRMADLPTAEQIQALEQRRTQLIQLTETIEATIPVMMEQAGEKGQAPAASGPSQAAGPARRAKFDSFEDFASKRTP